MTNLFSMVHRGPVDFVIEKMEMSPGYEDGLLNWRIFGVWHCLTIILLGPGSDSDKPSGDHLGEFCSIVVGRDHPRIACFRLRNDRLHDRDRCPRFLLVQVFRYVLIIYTYMYIYISTEWGFSDMAPMSDLNGWSPKVEVRQRTRVHFERFVGISMEFSREFMRNGRISMYVFSGNWWYIMVCL